MARSIDKSALRWVVAVAVALWSATATSAFGQIVAPSTYTTAIHVQGEVAGTEYDDWAASGIPVVTMDPADNLGDLDIANVQIANDANFIYIHATTHATSTISLVNIFLGFDVDQNKTTGFDVLQIGEIGSELGYQNDFPFAQHAGVFNLNLSIKGGPLANGGALIYPYWADASGPQGTQMEWAVPLDVEIQYPPALGGPKKAFTAPSFNFVVYTDQGLADISDVISYTLATPPTLEGDFDGDTDVDGHDLIKWQQGVGTLYDADDLADWKTHYGPTAVGAVSAVPEPATAGSALFGLAFLAGVRRRSRG